jgi:cytidylate kinase
MASLMPDPIVIAVDGTAASGKGTLAKLLARHFGFAHLDSGKLYRLVGLAVLDSGGNPDNEADALEAAAAIAADAGKGADNPRLLGDAVAAAASRVAAIAKLREALLDRQRQFARTPPRGAPGACIDGRDIGTVVCPDATAKLFVDAEPHVRARRRWLELKRLSPAAPVPGEAAILADILARDQRDRTRMIAPLKPAPDALLLDTSGLDIDTAFAAALALVEPRIKEALEARHRG